MSRAIIVFNPRSGSAAAQGDDLSRRLAARLAERGWTATSLPFDMRRRRPGTWRARLEAGLAEGAERVFVLGGDGTVLAVAEALIGRPVPLGIVPLGTANLLARDLGIPLEPDAAIEALIDAPARAIDVGRVNGTHFLCASMLGMSTALARTREAARGAGPLRLWGRLLRKGLWMLGRYPYRRVTLDLNGNTQTVLTRALVVTNNPLAPEPGLHPRRARLDLGVLGVYGLHKGPLWELPRLALRFLNGTWPEDPGIFHHALPQVRLQQRRGSRVTVMNDGERLRLTLPLHYEVLPAALAVLAPTAPDGVTA
jgi:diacylglycerol kinase family enzyme